MCNVHDFDGKPYQGIDLLAGGVLCPPFSIAGKQLGQDDERDLFPEAIRLIKEIKPRAVMLENVRGFLDTSFDEYQKNILTSIDKLGYDTQIKLLNASDFEGMPRLTSRMMARIQGFPDTWTFGKTKTVACRMIGNAFPSSVAQAVGEKIKECLDNGCINSTTLYLLRRKLPLGGKTF